MDGRPPTHDPRIGELEDTRQLYDQAKQRLGPEAPERDEHPVGTSGVLIPVVPSPDGPLVLFTRRSEHLSSHPGEISYPGGRMQEEDAGPRMAALREAREEIGLEAKDVHVAGHVTDFHTYRSSLIVGYLGILEPGTKLRKPLTPEEVTERILVPLSALLEGEGPQPALPEPDRGDLARMGNPYPVDRYEARNLPAEMRGGATLHYWHLDERSTVWGITGELTARWLGRVLDWTPPSAPERIRDPSGFRP